MKMRLPLVAALLALAAPALADKQAVLSARDVLHRAREAMKLERPRPLDTIHAEAACRGPERAFTTHIWSDYNGAMRFKQLHDGEWYRMGRDAGSPWSHGPDGYSDGDPAFLSFLQGHEFHMLAIAPETRLGIPTDDGLVELDGEAAHRLRFVDAVGAPAFVYYSDVTGLPLGAAYENHTGRGAREISVRFSSWPDGNGPRLFRVMTLQHGDESFRYDYTTLELDRAPDADFHPGREHDPDLAALLRFQLQQQLAHLMYDAELLVDLFAEPMTQVNRGEVSEARRAPSLERFGEYFERFTFTAWDDVEPPRIRFSDDRTLATVVVQKRVAGFVGEGGEDGETRFAWLESWRKRDGRWELVANVSTNR